MAPKRHEHLTHHLLRNIKTSTGQQDIKKIPSSPIITYPSQNTKKLEILS